MVEDASEDTAGHARVGEEAPGGGLDGSGRGVDLLQMEPPGQEADPGQGPGHHCPTSAAGTYRPPAGQPPRRRGTEVQLSPEVVRDGGGTPRNGDLLLVHLTSRTDRPAGSRTSSSVDRSLGVDAGGCFPQTRAPPTVACRPAAGGGGLPMKPKAPTVASATADSSVASPGVSPHLPPFTLLNEDNSCSMNAAVYTLWHVARCTCTMHLLPSALRTFAGPGMQARRSLGVFFLFGVAGRQAAARHSGIPGFSPSQGCFNRGLDLEQPQLHARWQRGHPAHWTPK